MPGRLPQSSDAGAQAAPRHGQEPTPDLARLLLRVRPQWMRDALCREYPGVAFFPVRGQTSAPAKAICHRCLVERECRAFALGNPDLTGVWGGTSDKERKAMRSRAAAA